MREPEEQSTRDLGRSTALLTVGVGLAGALTYVFFAIASHVLDKEDYGRVVVLWSAMFVGISVFCRPVEQLVSRTVSSLEARHLPTGHAIRVAVQIQLIATGGFLLLLFVFRDFVETELFDDSSIFFWALIVSVAGFGASFFARGLLAGESRFVTYASIVLVDALARTAFALALAVGLLNGPNALAVGIAVAPFLSLLPWPVATALARRRGHITPAGAQHAVQDADPDQAGLSLGEGGGFAAGVLLIMVSEQVFLNSGPLLAQVEVNAAAAGFVFNVLMVARAPILLFQAAASALLPHLTRLGSSANDRIAELRHSVKITLQAVCGFAVLTLGVLAVAGPALMELAFGSEFDYPREDLLIVAAGMGLYLAATTLTQAVMALGRVRLASAAWIVSALGLIGFFLSATGLDVATRAELGFAGASAVAAVLLAFAYRSSLSNHKDLAAERP